MIVFVLTGSSGDSSPLLDLNHRLWLRFCPRAEYKAVPTQHQHELKDVVNNILERYGTTGHRYALIAHEDCLPVRNLSIPDILKGHTLAGRTGHDELNPHPSRTWIASDRQTEGKTWVPYGDRMLTLDDFEGPPDVVKRCEWLEPGFLHLDSVWKAKSHALTKQKIDWVCSLFEESEYPSLPKRFIRFGKAVIDHVRTGRRRLKSEGVQARMKICRECVHFDARRNGCAKCGCNIHLKAQWAEQNCPMNLWPENIEEA